FMQQFYNETYQGRYSEYMDESLMTALWSLSVSFFPLGGFFGSLMVGPMVNNCGRLASPLGSYGSPCRVAAFLTAIFPRVSPISADPERRRRGRKDRYIFFQRILPRILASHCFGCLEFSSSLPSPFFFRVGCLFPIPSHAG
ncbi:hypothetical protein Chor_008321, partial [Crotalus horridus]